MIQSCHSNSDGRRKHRNAPKCNLNGKGNKYTPSSSYEQIEAKEWLKRAKNNAKTYEEKKIIEHIEQMYDFAEYEITTKKVMQNDL